MVSELRWTLLAVLLAQAAGVGGAEPEKPVMPLPWRVAFVDGETDEPIPGATVRCSVRETPGGETHVLTLITDEQGAIDIPLLPGEAVFPHFGSVGHWLDGIPVVGEFDIDDDGKFDTLPREALHQHRAWRGTVVRGRLLDPEGAPVADAPMIAGVYLYSDLWDERLGRPQRAWESWDHGQWPNWEAPYRTNVDGTFSVTVPPPDARSYIRLGTRSGGFYRVETDQLREQQPDHVLVRFAPLVFDISEHNQPDERPSRVSDDGSIDVGDLQLQNGVVLHGRVLDAAGQPLEGVHLYTSAEHGPLAGRTTVSQADGSYRFAPMVPGELTITPEATIRGPDGKKTWDVQAVFVPLPVRLPDDTDDLELDLRALDHVDLEFEWIDRRAVKGPIAYYGTHPVTGRIPVEGGKPLWWRGETFLVEREGKRFLTVKAPQTLIDAKIELASDSRVTARLEDADGMHRPGSTLLSDISQPARRTIYADEPQVKNR